jgi:hypothetical protein
LINLEEYKFLDGWSQDKKKGSSRCDRIPTELVDEIEINSLADYQKLIPEELKEGFTSKDFKKASKLPVHHARTALHVLHYIGAVERVGKNGNTFIYIRPDGNRNNSKAVTEETLLVAETAAGYTVPGKKKATAKKADSKEVLPTKKKKATPKKAVIT